MKTILNISVIPSAQPTNYTDKVIAKQPPIFQGVQENAIVTESPVRTKLDDLYLVRPVQMQVFKKYKIQFLVNSLYYLELVKYATKVTILQENEEEHIGQVLEVTRTLKAPDVYSVDLIYIDLSSEVVAEYMKSDTLTEDESFILSYAAGKSIMTKIAPIDLAVEPEQNTYTNNDINILAKSVLRKKKQYTFFISQADLIDLQDNIYTTLPNIEGLTAKEICTVGITQAAGVDIFKVVLDLVYEVKAVFMQ